MYFSHIFSHLNLTGHPLKQYYFILYKRKLNFRDIHSANKVVEPVFKFSLMLQTSFKIYSRFKE